jgi:cAMP-dependent protein kinase regulator
MDSRRQLFGVERRDGFVVDQDLFTGEFESVDSMEVEPAVEAEPAVSDPMTDSKFADELFSVLENAFPGPDAEPVTGEEGAAPSGGAQIVVSPLFKDFSVEELVAVIAGLKLLTFDRGKVILREGEPGNSLYMLTSGKVKAFVKKDGKQVPIAELEEGAFFGEMSILTGKPRTATIVATESSELLELDRPTLDSITQTHPHVWDVLQEFANQRMAKKS